ncbi:unnamed protein product, partial [Ectocarpus fasciculatus]
TPAGRYSRSRPCLAGTTSGNATTLEDFSPNFPQEGGRRHHRAPLSPNVPPFQQRPRWPRYVSPPHTPTPRPPPPSHYCLLLLHPRVEPSQIHENLDREKIHIESLALSFYSNMYIRWRGGRPPMRRKLSLAAAGDGTEGTGFPSFRPLPSPLRSPPPPPLVANKHAIHSRLW